MNQRKPIPIALIAIVSLALAGTATNLIARQAARSTTAKARRRLRPESNYAGHGRQHARNGHGSRHARHENGPERRRKGPAGRARGHGRNEPHAPSPDGPAHVHDQAAPATPQDWAKADEIASELRESIEKYKDYHVALADGFRIFMPNLPQAEYHFTNYYNGFLESFSFDPSRPTSLLYKKTKTGYDLIGAMYTMPKRVSEEQLNERVPLSVAQWHLHTNLCMPPKEERGHADLTRFGLQGSIHHQGSLHRGRRHFLPCNIWLDGARLSLREFTRKNLGTVAPRMH